MRKITAIPFKNTTTLLAVILCLLAISTVRGQENFGSDIVNYPVTYASPTAASFATYLEVPVDLVTGVPDISYNLLSIPTRSPHLSFNTSLSYHTANVRKKGEPSEAGLGWTVFGAASISRVMINEADEMNNGVIPQPGTYIRYDDEYTYNFAGYSGRFRLVKDTVANTYSILNMKANNLKFELENAYTDGKLGVTAYNVTDGNGISYRFSTLEKVNLTMTWHLTTVTDPAGQLLAECTYYTTYNDTYGSKYYLVKKLNAIHSIGFGTINYLYNSTIGAINPKLTGLSLKDESGNKIRSCTFNYFGSMLFSFSLNDNTDTAVEQYKFEYNAASTSQRTDNFGYPQFIDDCSLDYLFYHQDAVTPQTVASSMLRQVTLPTGGKIVYNFEANRWTLLDFVSDNVSMKSLNLNDDLIPGYIRGQSTDYNQFIPEPEGMLPVYISENPENSYLEEIAPITINTATSSDPDGNFLTPVFTEPVDLYILMEATAYPSPIEPENYTPQLSFSLLSDNTTVPAQPAFESLNANCLKIKRFTVPAGGYAIKLFRTGDAIGKFRLFKRKTITNIKKWSYGPGVRIADIKYYSTTLEAPEPVKTVSYDYSSFADPNNTSGQLLIERYLPDEKRESRVIYKNIKVTDGSGNGYTKYCFYTPFDKAGLHFPLLIDGLLKYTDVYDDQDRKLKSTLYAYDIDKNPSVQYQYFPYSGVGFSFREYVLRTYVTSNAYSFDPPAQFTTTSIRITNPLNYMPASETTFDSNGIKEKKATFYAKDLTSEPNASVLIAKNMVQLSLKTAVFKNDIELSSQKVLYKDWGNGLLAPEKVLSSKSGMPYEERASINKYDAYGHVLEVQKTGGVKTAYIWGYNTTVPVAKAENIAYDAITPSLITDIKNATDIANNDPAVVTALENLRSNTVMATAMLTAATLKPLVGALTVMDAKGDKALSIYDAFGRLSQSKDRYGNILSENAYVYGTKNYVRTTAYKKPTLNGTTVNTTTLFGYGAANITDTDKATSITYFDGLGRAVEQIIGRQSNDGKDIVTPIKYDALGRKAKDLLPYPSGQTTQAFINVDAAETALKTYYTSTFNDSIAYSLKEFEHSPLNRVLKQSAPGEAWKMGNGHEIKFAFAPNLATDLVPILSATSTLSSSDPQYASKPFAISLAFNGNYAEGTLYKNTVSNENVTGITNLDGITLEFKDKSGHVVLKRSYGYSEADDAVMPHDTRYIYDQFGNLTYVVPPIVDVSAGVSGTDLEKYCYQYKYDYRNRMVEKKLPGRDWEFIVYDKLDRVVATGPAEAPFTDRLNKKGWLVSKYDVFGRNVLTGWMETAVTFDSASRQALQEVYNGQTVLYETKRTDANTTVGGIAFRYTNAAYPTTGYQVLTLNYFDNYAFPEMPTIPGVSENQTVYYTNTVKPIGMPTGSYRRLLQATTNTNRDMTVDFFDYKGRVIRSFTRSYIAGGYQQEDTKYDFVKILLRAHRHNRNTTVAELHTREFFTYDVQDRVVKQSYAINSSVEAGAQLMAYNTYDRMGQLVSKKTGGTDLTAATYYQKIDYSYNIRGWLKTINDVDDLADGVRPDLFAFRLNYDTTENMTGYQGTALYNGNISETIWRTGSDNTKRKYGYFYDGLNRLNKAVYMKPALNGTVSHSYDEKVKYDKNGNIGCLIRNGLIDENPTTVRIDSLRYAYDGNRLFKVTDHSGNQVGFKDDKATDPNDTSDDYGYDGYGNMKRDDNKGITGIIYNHLNLPMKLTFANGSIIEYLYNAVGMKLKKTYTPSGGTAVVTDYLWGYQYQDGVLQFFGTPEGYVKNTVTPSGNSYNYVFTFKDHLGNSRVSYGMDPGDNVLKIMEDNAYYPFGMRHEGYNTTSKAYVNAANGVVIDTPASNSENVAFMYKYNGKELQAEEDLGWYDYGRRNYDASVGRFFNMDRLSEFYSVLSTYQYAGNNPILFIDFKGDKIVSGTQYYDRLLLDVQAFKDKVLEDENNISIAFGKGDIEQYNKLIKESLRKYGVDNSTAYMLISQVLVQLVELDCSVVNFSYFTYTPEAMVSEEGEATTSYNIETKTVEFRFREGYDFTNFLHESTHGYQYLTGKISFDGTGRGRGMLTDINDEYEAYKFSNIVAKSKISKATQNSHYKNFSNRNLNLNSIINGNYTFRDYFEKKLKLSVSNGNCAYAIFYWMGRNLQKGVV